MAKDEVCVEAGGEPVRISSPGKVLFPDQGWTKLDVRRAAVAFAREVERRAPTIATAARWKEERRGVFLDFHQNARDQTIASADSVRETGRVSAPFRWDELHAIDPLALDLPGFAARWEDVGDLAAGMDAAAGRLDGLLALANAADERGLPDLPWPPHDPKQPDEPRGSRPRGAARTPTRKDGDGAPRPAAGGLPISNADLKHCFVGP